ncbi:DUF2867 domain-containing protein [Woodsholea maritima]|uniref:DUF2867 domain-containing protein n=1 Tax=Woodsholea maritima TaxID=240237 RepID=UPI00035F81F1|nr:DUF2867 domain-containing protein [Woodsholea maritima]
MIRSDTLPYHSLLCAYVAPKDYVDVYSADLSVRPDLMECDIRVLAQHCLCAEIKWAKHLLKLRDLIVKPLGLKSTDLLSRDDAQSEIEAKGVGDRIDFFKIYQITADEILLGEDDRHQDFRVSVMRQRGDHPRLYVATCCKRHNFLGYAYLAIILPFHKAIVMSGLRRALQDPLRP